VTKISSADNNKQKFIATATSLEGSKKTNFRSIIYSHSFINSDNLAKIIQVDFEMIGLTEIVKK